MFLNSNEQTVRAWPCAVRRHSQVVEPWTEHVKTSTTTPWKRMVEIRKATPIAAFEDEYDKLEAIVGEARWILDLVDNFDGRGSPRYSEETFERAVAFVKLQ